MFDNMSNAQIQYTTIYAKFIKVYAKIHLKENSLKNAKKNIYSRVFLCILCVGIRWLKCFGAADGQEAHLHTFTLYW